VLIALALDPREAAFLVASIRLGRADARRNGHSFPAGIDELERLLLATPGDSPRQPATPRAESASPPGTVEAMTVAEYAAHRDVTARTVQRWVKAGTVTRLPGGRKILIPRRPDE
jgi:hypothetical protein